MQVQRVADISASCQPDTLAVDVVARLDCKATQTGQHYGCAEAQGKGALAQYLQPESYSSR